MQEDLENQTTQDNSQELSTENLETESKETSTEQPDQAIDLESVSKFRFGGREWTPKDFQGAYMMQSDYTRKTNELAQERKYYDNLATDLESVKRNPSLAAQFKSVYPEKFHNYLNYVQKVEQAQAEKTPGVDPQFMDRFTKVENALKEQKVAAIEAELDSKFKQLSEKYNMADEEAVVARAQALLDRGESLNDKAWDQLWKSVHDRNSKLAEQYYSQRVNQQKTANSKSRDVGAGGGTPGQAPKMPRTIKEATAMALQEMENS